MEFESYLPVWDQLEPAKKERILSGRINRHIPKGTIIHNGSSDCTGLLLIRS